MPKKRSRQRKKGRGTSSAAAAKNKKADNASATQKLPSKEAHLFKQIIRLYETKQYKKGIKVADAILKKFPDHGETLAMKGLVLNCSGKKEEANEFVRKGLKMNPKSHVCWHVYGLMFRSEQKYEKAVKSYKMAIRLDPKNVQILRDMSIMQIQTRDMAGFLKSRNELLQLKSNKKDNWIGFAIAQHLNGNHKTAMDVLAAYRGTLEDKEEENFSNSEIVMYENMIMREYAEPLKVLQHLDKNRSVVLSKLEWVIARSRVLLRLGRFDETRKAYERLIKVNPENYGFHRGFHYSILKRVPGPLSSNPKRMYDGAFEPAYVGDHLPLQTEELTAEERAVVFKANDAVRKLYPKARAPKMIAMLYGTDSAFESLVREDLLWSIRRGMPSYFNELKAIYRQEPVASVAEQKRATVLKAIEEHVARLRRNRTSATKEEKSSDNDDEPHMLPHALLLLAQHQDMRGNLGAALDAVNEAIEHTPTIVELYMFKARVLKHMGDLDAATATVDIGRELDLADRFINCKCTKYLLRMGKMQQAQETAELFLKSEEGIVTRSLEDMQAMWYLYEAGNGYLRQGDYGRALKKLLAVRKIFEQYMYDQFDFHSYCLHKLTLRAYVRLLRMEDKLHSHDTFLRASASAVRCYLSLHANKQDASSKVNSGEDKGNEAKMDLSSLTPAERKRYKAEQRKLKRHELAKKKEQETGKSSQGKKEDASKKKVDEDPNGEKLASVANPLDEAFKIVSSMEMHAPYDPVTNIAAFDVWMKRGKLLPALRSLRRLTSASRTPSPFTPEVRAASCRRVCQFLTRAASLNDASHPIVRKVLRSEVEALFATHSAAEYAATFLNTNGDSHFCIAAAVEFCGDPKLAQVLIDAVASASAKVRLTHSSCIEAQRVIEAVAPTRAKEHLACALKAFPRSASLLEKVDSTGGS